MDKKSFWNDNFLGFALKNILIAVLIVAGLVWGAFILINIYTNHGKTEQVPNLKGLTTRQAEMILNNHSLKMEIIDSIYTKDAKLGSIIDQNPTPKTIVKPGRLVYLVVNSSRVKQVPIPQVVETSLRQAVAMLNSVGIQVGRVSQTPSDYKDLVLGMMYNGKPIKTGTKINEGSSVVLIVGSGVGGQKSLVPSLKGMSMEDAKNTINMSAYNVGGIIYDEEPMGDEADFYVYKQRPFAGDSISLGARIDIWLSKDKNKKDEDAIVREQEKAKIRQEEKTKKKDIEDFF